MASVWRLTWRVGRFEIIFLVILAVALTTAQVYFIQQLTALRPAADCAAEGLGPECFDAARPYYDTLAVAGQVLGLAGLLLPLVVGTLLGSQLVAREIEHRTAQLAWSFARTRRRWFLERLSVLLVLAVVTLVPLVISSHVLEGAIQPAVDPWASVADLSLRGPDLLTRGLATLGLGLLAGAILGRALPALLVSALLGIVLFVGGGLLPAVVLPIEVVGTAGEQRIVGSLITDSRYMDPDGRLLTFDQALAAAPAGMDPYTWTERYTPVLLGISGQRYPAVESTTAILYGLLCLAGGLLAVLVVDRRRPY